MSDDRHCPPVDSAATPPSFADTVQQSGRAEQVKVGRHPSQPVSAGGYQIVGEIGRGGMGVVYRAYDAELKRHVALKMLWSGIEASPHELSRFRGEAEIVASLTHPNIVHIYDIGIHDGHPYLALELIEGGRLDLITEHKPQTPRFAASMVETLARAMHVAHGQGIIHRDLKPANVLLTADGTPKITDFGIAKRLGDSSDASRTGDIKGTPSYMAPEQADGRTREYGPAADIYALGVILYELLTGRLPFLGADIFETLEQVRAMEPASPSRLIPRLPRDLSTICLKCLEKSPERRYSSAAELADDLHRWQRGETILARPVGRAERFARMVKRHPLATGLIAATVLATVALVLYGFAAAERSHEARLRREMEEQFDHSLAALDDISNLVIYHERISRLSGLEPLHDKLLDFYEKLIERRSELSSSRQQTLAGACVRLGTLMGKTGNKTGSAEAFQQARELYATLAGQEPASEQHRLEVAQCDLELGKLARDLGRMDESERRYAEARSSFDQLKSAAPLTPIFRQQLAEVWHNLGILYDATKRKPEALTAYAEARSLRQNLLNEDNDNVHYCRDLARSHGYIGDTQLDLGQRTEAHSSYLASHQLREKLAEKRPNDPEAKFQLARSHGNFGNYHTRLRDFAAARAANEHACRIQEALVRGEPAVAEYRVDLVRTLSRLAELSWLESGYSQRQAAETFLRRAVEVFPAQSSHVSCDALVRSSLAEAKTLQAVIGWDTNQAAALESLGVAEELLNDLSRQRGDALDWYYLAVVHGLRADKNTTDSAAANEAVGYLNRAIARGYRRKHPVDLAREPAFRGLAQQDEFQRLIEDYKRVWPDAGISPP